MSTELLDVKQLVDEIHDAARVPEKLNPDIYVMTHNMIQALILSMDEYGLTHGEQRMRMGRKKDELISELIRLRDQGVLRSGEEGQLLSTPVVIPAAAIRVTR